MIEKLNDMKCALITGITGQDGAYLTKFLLQKGYEVIGTIRDNDDFSKLEYLGVRECVKFIKCDFLNQNDVFEIIRFYKPDEIYNLASQSSVSASFVNPLETLQFNIMSVVNLLEGIRNFHNKTKFFQASSCEMFGESSILPVNENSKFNPTNSYAISKVSAQLIVDNYRLLYGIFSCCGILFHHESFLRGQDFFIKKLLKQALEIKYGVRKFLTIGNLDTKRDLGYAPAYVEVMWLMLQAEKPDNYIVSSGKSILLKDIVDYVFNKLSLSKKDNLIVDKNLFRMVDIKETLGDSSKLKNILGWKYDLNFYDVLDLLINEEIKCYENFSHKNKIEKCI